jgi:hypothetical protein
MFHAMRRGAIAGAAGTTALNAATYLDMAVRARPASDTPQRAVEKISEQAGRPVSGIGEERENRLAGLGPLTGIASGVGIGVAAGLLRPLLVRLPPSLGALLIGGAAMAASNVPLAKFGLADPSKWTATDWLSEAAPHFAYGVVAFRALQD